MALCRETVGRREREMTRTTKTLALAAPVALALCLVVYHVGRAARQDTIAQHIQVMRGEAATLVKTGKFAEAADKFEQLQIVLMKAKRYEEALQTSFTIEEVSEKASERRSPWNYVRIGEVHLAMGHVDQFFGWLEKAVAERSFSKLDYFRGFQLASVRNHPRFKKLVAACAAIIGVGQPAKDFQVPLLDGSPFVLSAQRGKVVLVDLWDVRCGPCRREMPNLKAIYGDFKDKGLDILGISLDTEKALLDDYLKEAALPWKIACSWDGWNDRTAKLYKISATPSTWLIDRHGILRYYDVRGEELRRAVETLLGES
jgi:peroxiredoxin